MEAQPQSDGGRGRNGGPPLVACGYSDSGDGKPRKNARERRRPRPHSKGFDLPQYLTGVIGEYRRLAWPRTQRWLATTLFFAIILLLTGLVLRS